MRARLNHLRETLRSSLWLVPSLMSVGAAALAFAMLRVDEALPGETGLPMMVGFTAEAEAARALLTTLAGAMMGVTGVTFSITVVALSLASQQFGPRLLRNFLRDRANHVVLGTFLATFVYAILILQAIEEDPEGATLPRVSLTVAIALALASLAVLIYFVHHVAHGIQADSVIASVARELQANVDRMYPERMGEEPTTDRPESLVPEEFDARAVPVRATTSGYLQAVDEHAFLALATRRGLVVRLVHRPGDFVIEGSPLALAWPPEKVDEGAVDEARALLILGHNRTAEQDVEFSIDQLVEVGVRALSPGINDPFTAVRCIDRLGAGLCRLCNRKFPSPYRHDADGNLRIVARRPDFQGLVDASFNQIRQYGRASPAVTIRLLEVIEVVAGCAGPRERLRAPLRAQAERVFEGAQDAGHSASDLRDVERRYRDAMATLTSGESAGGVAMQPRKRE